ncbi:hypothetical protein BT69DRAFT_1329071 [Atractiella rhizophila]|nr:hypothetical protein BT69DRAFT_1329071 [Atractiella rhizophila]
MSYTADASGSETIFQPYPHIQYQADDVFIRLLPSDTLFDTNLPEYPHIQYQADDVFIRLLPSDTLFDTNLPEDSVLLPVAQTGLFVPIPKMRAMIHGFYTLAGKGQGQAKAWVENIVDYADLEDSFEGELPPKESEDLKRRINTKSIRMRGKRERIDKGLGYKGAWKGKPWPLDMCVSPLFHAVPPD